LSGCETSLAAWTTRRALSALRGFGRPPPAGRVTLSCAPGAAEPLRVSALRVSIVAAVPIARAQSSFDRLAVRRAVVQASSTRAPGAQRDRDGLTTHSLERDTSARTISPSILVLPGPVLLFGVGSRPLHDGVRRGSRSSRLAARAGVEPHIAQGSKRTDRPHVLGRTGGYAEILT
jgi:hypothetical protein